MWLSLILNLFAAGACAVFSGLAFQLFSATFLHGTLFGLLFYTAIYLIASLSDRDNVG